MAVVARQGEKRVRRRLDPRIELREARLLAKPALLGDGHSEIPRTFSGGTDTGPTIEKEHERSGPLQPILSGCARQSAGVLQGGGSGVARAHGALEGGREAGRRPIAGEDEVAARGAGRGTSRRILGGRREGRPALLDDLPGRQRLRPKTGEAGDLGPDRLRQGLARLTRRRSAPLMVTDRRSGKANSHSRESADERR